MLEAARFQRGQHVDARATSSSSARSPSSARPCVARLARPASDAARIAAQTRRGAAVASRTPRCRSIHPGGSDMRLAHLMPTPRRRRRQAAAAIAAAVVDRLRHAERRRRRRDRARQPGDGRQQPEVDPLHRRGHRLHLRPGLFEPVRRPAEDHVHSQARSINYDTARRCATRSCSAAPKPMGGGGYPHVGPAAQRRSTSAARTRGTRRPTRPAPGPRFVADRVHQLWITPHGVIKAAHAQQGTTAQQAAQRGITRWSFSEPGRRRPPRSSVPTVCVAAGRIARARSGAGRSDVVTTLFRLPRLRRRQVPRPHHADARRLSGARPAR